MENQKLPHCGSEHEQIMFKLSSIEKRMDDDWLLIKSSHEDRIRREGIWNVIKWAGLSGIILLLSKLFDS